LNFSVKRKKTYDNIISKYLFILKLQEYTPSESEIRNVTKKLRILYNEDLDELFDSECIHFQCLLNILKKPPT